MKRLVSNTRKGTERPNFIAKLDVASNEGRRVSIPVDLFVRRGQSGRKKRRRTLEEIERQQ